MSAAVWRRRGEEAETDDFRAGNPVCVDEAEVYSALAASLDGDLPQDDPERTEALEEAVEGYLQQAKSRAAESVDMSGWRSHVGVYDYETGEYVRPATREDFLARDDTRIVGPGGRRCRLATPGRYDAPITRS